MASAAHEDGLCDDRRVNPLDALVLLLLVAGVILGWRSGAIPQVAGLLGAVGGGALVILVLPSLADPRGWTRGRFTKTGLSSAFRPEAAAAERVPVCASRLRDRRIDGEALPALAHRLEQDMPRCVFC